MFKLVKILYSATNQPEPIRIPATEGETYKKGQPMKIVSGRLTKITSAEKPVYMTMETKIACSEDDTVLCYLITPNMIFETYTYTSRVAELINSQFGLVGSPDNWDGVGESSGTSATYYDVCGAKGMRDRVLIRFV